MPDHCGFVDLFDIKKFTKLFKALQANAHTESICSKLVFLGMQGAGKSSTIHFLCGASFQKICTNNLLHMSPKPVDSLPALKQIKVSPGAKSETSRLATVYLNLSQVGVISQQESVLLCDTPGLGGSESLEADLAKRLSINHFLSNSKEVRLVLLVSYQSLGERMNGLRVLAAELTKIFPDFADYISSFAFIFTQFPKNEASEILASIQEFRQSLSNDVDENQSLFQLINAMEYQLNHSPFILELLTDKPEVYLEKILEIAHVGYPAEAFNLPEDNEAYLILSESLHKIINDTKENLEDHSIDAMRDYKNVLCDFKSILPAALFNRVEQNLDDTVKRQIDKRVKLALDDLSRYLSNSASFQEDGLYRYQQEFMIIESLNELIKNKHPFGDTLQHSYTEFSIANFSDMNEVALARNQLKKIKQMSVQLSDKFWPEFYQTKLADYCAWFLSTLADLRKRVSVHDLASIPFEQIKIMIETLEGHIIYLDEHIKVDSYQNALINIKKTLSQKLLGEYKLLVPMFKVKNWKTNVINKFVAFYKICDFVIEDKCLERNYPELEFENVFVIYKSMLKDYVSLLTRKALEHLRNETFFSNTNLHEEFHLFYSSLYIFNDTFSTLLLINDFGGFSKLADEFTSRANQAYRNVESKLAIALSANPPFDIGAVEKEIDLIFNCSLYREHLSDAHDVWVKNINEIICNAIASIQLKFVNVKIIVETPASIYHIYDLLEGAKKLEGLAEKIDVKFEIYNSLLTKFDEGLISICNTYLQKNNFVAKELSVSNLYNLEKILPWLYAIITKAPKQASIHNAIKNNLQNIQVSLTKTQNTLYEKICFSSENSDSHQVMKQYCALLLAINKLIFTLDNHYHSIFILMKFSTFNLDKCQRILEDMWLYFSDRLSCSIVLRRYQAVLECLELIKYFTDINTLIHREKFLLLYRDYKTKLFDSVTKRLQVIQRIELLQLPIKLNEIHEIMAIKDEGIVLLVRHALKDFYDICDYNFFSLKGELDNKLITLDLSNIPEVMKTYTQFKQLVRVSSSMKGIFHDDFVSKVISFQEGFEKKLSAMLTVYFNKMTTMLDNNQYCKFEEHVENWLKLCELMPDMVDNVRFPKGFTDVGNFRSHHLSSLIELYANIACEEYYTHPPKILFSSMREGFHIHSDYRLCWGKIEKILTETILESISCRVDSDMKSQSVDFNFWHSLIIHTLPEYLSFGLLNKLTEYFEVIDYESSSEIESQNKKSFTSATSQSYFFFNSTTLPEAKTKNNKNNSYCCMM